MSRIALRYSETQDPKAFICLTCDKLLRDIMATEKKLEVLRGKITENLERLQRSSSSCEPLSNSKRPRFDYGVQLQEEQFSTDTQPPLEAQEDVENICNLQESGSLEGCVDMEVSDEVLETIGEQSSSRSNDLRLSQTSAGCQLTPGQSPPVKVSFKITIICYAKYT